jgi:hypothetical protein
LIKGGVSSVGPGVGSWVLAELSVVFAQALILLRRIRHGEADLKKVILDSISRNIVAKIRMRKSFIGVRLKGFHKSKD